MRLFYWAHPDGNVGDDLNPWLWPQVLGPDFFDEDDSSGRFLGIGSILTPRHLLPPPGRNVIFGSGLRSGKDAPEVLQQELDLRCVRGPRSAAALGGVRYICDPAVLTPRFAGPAPQTVPGRVGFVPYLRTPPDTAARIADRTGTHLMPVTLPVETFLAELRSCERVVCEAMHGAILADAFRIPWTACRISSELFEGSVSSFKWTDWQESLGLSVSLASAVPGVVGHLPRRLRRLALGSALARGPDLVADLIKRDDWTLSRDDALSSAQDALLEAAQTLKNELL